MPTQSKIPYYDQVADLYEALGVPVEQNAEFSMNNLLSLHKSIPYKSPVFRANYYSFVFVKSGAGNYTSNEHKFEYTSRTIYFTNPGPLKSFEFYELEEAYLVTFSEKFLRQNVHKEVFEEFTFLLAEIVSPQTLSEAKFAEFEQLYQQILAAYQGTSDYRFRIIGNLFVVILLKIKEQFWVDYLPVQETDRASLIVQSFRESLEAHFLHLAEGTEQVRFRPADFAAALHLNPGYFSSVVKGKTGKSVGAWITDKAISLATALLIHSSMSVKEIGLQLGYWDTAHFSNFFKKQTGLTPTDYRERHG